MIVVVLLSLPLGWFALKIREAFINLKSHPKPSFHPTT